MANHVELFVHLVWAVDRRRPLLVPPIERPVHGWIGGKCRDLGCTAIAVGGMPDHVHLLVALHPAVSVASLVSQVKGVSSHGVTHVLRSEPTFAWQSGYGAFTLRRADVATVKAYVLRQPEHHAVGSVDASLEAITDQT